MPLMLQITRVVPCISALLHPPPSILLDPALHAWSGCFCDSGYSGTPPHCTAHQDVVQMNATSGSFIDTAIGYRIMEGLIASDLLCWINLQSLSLSLPSNRMLLFSVSWAHRNGSQVLG